MNFKAFGSVRAVSPVHPLNALPIVFKDFGNVKAVSPLQPSNAESSMNFNADSFGSVSEMSRTQLANAPSEILSIELGR